MRSMEIGKAGEKIRIEALEQCFLKKTDLEPVSLLLSLLY